MTKMALATVRLPQIDLKHNAPLQLQERAAVDAFSEEALKRGLFWDSSRPSVSLDAGEDGKCGEWVFKTLMHERVEVMLAEVVY